MNHISFLSLPLSSCRDLHWPNPTGSQETGSPPRGPPQSSLGGTDMGADPEGQTEDAPHSSLLPSSCPLWLWGRRRSNGWVGWGPSFSLSLCCVSLAPLFPAHPAWPAVSSWPFLLSFAVCEVRGPRLTERAWLSCLPSVFRPGRSNTQSFRPASALRGVWAQLL